MPVPVPEVPVQPFIHASLARVRAEELDRRAAMRRRCATHTYAPPHVVERPRPLGPDTFDDSVW